MDDATTQQHETPEQVGVRIGRAIARDVIAEAGAREWSGLDPQDADQIPEGMELAAVEATAKAAYLAAVDPCPATGAED